MATTKTRTKRPSKQAAQAPKSDDMAEITPRAVGIWGIRLLVYFVALGGIALLVYAVKGWGTNPQSLSVGFRIGPGLAAIYLVLGAAGTLVGFFMQRFAMVFLPVFALAMVLLAILGSVAPQILQLTSRDTIFHWCVAAVALALWLYVRAKEKA
jgi:hypothetical protein